MKHKADDWTNDTLLRLADSGALSGVSLPWLRGKMVGVWESVAGARRLMAGAGARGTAARLGRVRRALQTLARALGDGAIGEQVALSIAGERAQAREAKARRGLGRHDPARFDRELRRAEADWARLTAALPEWLEAAKRAEADWGKRAPKPADVAADRRRRPPDLQVAGELLYSLYEQISGRAAGTSVAPDTGKAGGPAVRFIQAGLGMLGFAITLAESRRMIRDIAAADLEEKKAMQRGARPDRRNAKLSNKSQS